MFKTQSWSALSAHNPTVCLKTLRERAPPLAGRETERGRHATLLYDTYVISLDSSKYI